MKNETCIKHGMKITELERDMNEMGKKFNAAIYGNGKPGLIADVEKLDKNLAVFKKEISLKFYAMVAMFVAIAGVLG